MEDLVAIIRPSGPRRAFAIALLAAMAFLLLYLAFMMPPEDFLWQAFLVAVGLGSIYLAFRFRNATRSTLELRDGALSDSAGMTLCTLDEIVAVERGTFAFKPSNGFLLVLREKKSGHWSPGLWWRMGRRVGVGGVVPSGASKFMAEMIALKLAERERGEG